MLIYKIYLALAQKLVFIGKNAICKLLSNSYKLVKYKYFQSNNSNT